MTKHDAWLYAASWGSAITGGDPGACLYGFDESFVMQSEAHRADVLAQMVKNRAAVLASPADYDADELAQIDVFMIRAKAARIEGQPDALDAAGADDFARGYIAALIWTNEEPSCESVREWEADAAEDDASGRALPAHVTADDFHPGALAECLADCAAFQAKAAAMLAEAGARGYSASRAGHDFWLTRNHHGAGFWEREELEDDSDEYEALTAVMVAASKSGDNAAWDKACAARSVLKAAALGARLTAVAVSFGEVDPYLGDDGLIYL